MLERNHIYTYRHLSIEIKINNNNNNNNKFFKSSLFGQWTIIYT
jgi:hypothetical protein